MTKKIILSVLVFLVIAGGLVWLNRDRVMPLFFKPTDSTIPSAESGIPESSSNSASEPLEKVIAENLDTPWEMVFLPDGSLLVTERGGAVKRVNTTNSDLRIEGVVEVGEGGLLGMALHPDFSNNRYIYFYYTTRSEGKLINRVERYKLDEQKLSDKRVVVDNIPAAGNHDGGRIAFGPDRMLYIATGDAQETSLAQDRNSLAGKILRVRDDGAIPEDNPYQNAVFSYGHRNPQGLAWDDRGQLWATEHGPSGAQTGDDELNLIEKGKNYGWPTIKGNQTRENMEIPIVSSGSKETWAPAGMAHLNGTLFFAGLRGQALYAAKIVDDGKSVSLEALLKNKYGRLRAVTVGPDGYVYISTSNRE